MLGRSLTVFMLLKVVAASFLISGCAATSPHGRGSQRALSEPTEDPWRDLVSQIDKAWTDRNLDGVIQEEELAADLYHKLVSTTPFDGEHYSLQERQRKVFVWQFVIGPSQKQTQRLPEYQPRWHLSPTQCFFSEPLIAGEQVDVQRGSDVLRVLVSPELEAAWTNHSMEPARARDAVITKNGTTMGVTNPYECNTAYYEYAVYAEVWLTSWAKVALPSGRTVSAPSCVLAYRLPTRNKYLSIRRKLGERIPAAEELGYPGQFRLEEWETFLVDK